MRVLFTVSSWPTHYATLVPIGWALQAAGHEVRVLCAADQVGPVSRAGLLPVPVLDGMAVVTRLRLQYYEEARDGHWPYPWLPPHPVTGERMGRLSDFAEAEFRDTVLPAAAEREARGFDEAVRYARRWRPDLVLHDPVSLEGLLVARVLDLPSLLSLWGPVGTCEAAHMRIVPDDFSGSFVRYGLGEFDPAMIDSVIDPCPPGLTPPGPVRRLPVRYVPYNGGGSVPGWLAPPVSRPRVCVTWSTALSSMSGPDSYLLPELVWAMDGLPYEVLLTATPADVARLGPVPANVRVVERVPLQALLTGAAAVLHHGGSGSTLTALLAGVPQLITTFASEQATTGQRAAGAGVAVHLPGHQADRAAVRAAVRRLVESPAHGAAAALARADMLARPTPAELVADLEELAAGGATAPAQAGAGAPSAMRSASTSPW